MSEVPKTRLERELAKAEEDFLEGKKEIEKKYADNPLQLKIVLSAHESAYESIKRTIIAMDEKLQTVVQEAKKSVDDSDKKYPSVANKEITDVVKAAIDRIANR